MSHAQNVRRLTGAALAAAVLFGAPAIAAAQQVEVKPDVIVIGAILDTSAIEAQASEEETTASDLPVITDDAEASEPSAADALTDLGQAIEAQ
jgi:hypothetical protein